MSQLDGDFEDDWDDFTPSFQDKLIEYVENNTFTMENNNTHHDLDNGLSMNFTSSKAAFDVFLDELFEIPIKVKKDTSRRKPLGEISTNQQQQKDKQHNGKAEKVNVEKEVRFSDSQDDSLFWSDFDDSDLLSKLESDVDKQKPLSVIKEEPPKNNATPPPSTSFSGFRTASGKTLQAPSEEAIQKAKLQWEDEMLNQPAETSFVGGFVKAGSGKKIEVSDRAKLTAKTLFEEEEDTPTLTGFKTASGKVLKEISETAKQRVIDLFRDLEEDANQKISNKRPIEEPLDTCTKYETVIDKFGGFQMGNNQRGVAVSSNTKRQAVSVLDVDSTVPSPSKLMTEKDLNNNEPSKPLVVPDVKNQSSDSTPLKPSTSSSMLPKRGNRVSAIQKQNKPFKSPIVRSDLTRQAVENKNINNKLKTKPVFDLTVPKNRYTLASLGKPLQWNKQQLLSINIPLPIIDMTIESAKNYLFDDYWGYKLAQKDLIHAGALATRVPLDWVENHYGLIVWKFACLIRSYPSEFSNYWCPTKVLEQLLYRYEREVNMGHRPILKKVLEQDDISVKHMVLVVSEIVKLKKSLFFNTSSKYSLVLTDGWYQVPACIDFRMERAIDKNKLKVGLKLSICGAQIVGDKTAQSPLTITNNSTMLSISTNGCLPARWDTKLGYQKQKLIMRSIATVFDDGGLITALDIIVCRKFPILYSETLPNGMVVTRTAKEEEEARHIPDPYNSLQRQKSAFLLPNFKVDHKKKMNHSPHLDRTNSEPKKLEERRVMGYFKVRICDAKSSPNQPLATLLISNANELNHMDIVEGNRYKVFFVVPYRSKNRKYVGLDLKTTRMTRWEPSSSNNLTNAYIPRYLTLCKDIHRQDVTLDFDLVVFVLQASLATLDTSNGRKLYHQKLFVSDESGKICQIDFRVPLNPFPPDVKGQVIGLQNVRFELHDNKFDITCLKATDETEVVAKLSTASEYIQKGILNLRKWIPSNPKQVQELSDRLKTIIQ